MPIVSWLSPFIWIVLIAWIIAFCGVIWILQLFNFIWSKLK